MNDTTSQAVNLTGDVPRPRLQAYAEKYRHVFAFERKDGVLETRVHHDGGVRARARCRERATDENAALGFGHGRVLFLLLVSRSTVDRQAKGEPR